METKVFSEETFEAYANFLLTNEISVDIYYTPGYLRADAGMQGGKPFVFSCWSETGIYLYPYIELPMEQYGLGGYIDITSPYGYGGPYSRGEMSRQVCEQELLLHLKDRQVVTEFVRYHTDYHTETDFFDTNITNLPVRENLVLNLTDSWDTIWMKQMSGTNRNIVKKLRSEGFTINWSKSTDAILRFVKSYHRTMQNATAAQFYYFSEEYFIGLFNDLGNAIILASVEKEGVTYASGLFFLSDGILTYHLGARNFDFANVPASNLLLTDLAKWGIDNGANRFNLGGGISGMTRDSLFKFKANFTKNTKVCYIGKRVHLPDIYQELKQDYIVRHTEEKFNQVKHLLQFYRA